MVAASLLHLPQLTDMFPQTYDVTPAYLVGALNQSRLITLGRFEQMMQIGCLRSQLIHAEPYSRAAVCGCPCFGTTVCHQPVGAAGGCICLGYSRRVVSRGSNF